MDAKGYIHTITDPVPGIGTIVSIGLPLDRAFHRDPAKAVAHALNGFQGLGLCCTLWVTDGACPAFPLAVFHDKANTVTDKAVELLFKSPEHTAKRADEPVRCRNITSLPKDATLKLYSKDKKDGYKYTHVLILHDEKDREGALQFLGHLPNTTENDVLRVIQLYGATFFGKFPYPPYSETENIYFTLPFGLYHGAPCTVFTTFTVDADNVENRELASTQYPVQITDRENGGFQVGKEKESYYLYKGAFPNRWDEVKLQLWSQGKAVSYMDLTLWRKDNL
ncbi:hypothetical protein MY11210_005520 [Beauveria gryllotalpidicola]